MPGAGGREVGRISIRVVPDLDQFWSDLKGKLEEVERSLKAEVGVIPKMDEFRERVKAETEGLKADVKVKTDLDKSDFAKTLAETKAAAKAADFKLDIDFRDKEAEAKLAMLIAKLKAEARLANIDIGVRAEERGFSGGGSILGGVASGAGSLLAAMKDNTVMIVVGVLALLAPALSLLASSLVALPALISAVALPLGVFALGLGGIKKALEDVGLATEDKDKKGNDKGKLKIGDTLKAIQQPISDVFEKGLVPLFQRLLDTAPQLTSALPRVAQGLVDLFGGLVNSITSGPGLANLKSLTANVGGLLSGMAPGITSFSNAIIELAAKVSSHFPGLASWFNKIGDEFSGWVDKISHKNWFTGKSELDNAISGLKPAMDGIISFLGRLLDAGIKLGQDPELANKIKAFFDDITNVVVNALPQLNRGFRDLVNVLTTLSGAVDLITGKNPADHSQLPSGQAGQQLPKWQQQIPGTGLNPFGDFDWKQFLLQNIPGVGFLVDKVYQWFQGVDWGQVWNGLVESAASLVTRIGPTISNVVNGIVAFFQGLPAMLSSIWSAVVSAAQSAWSGLASAAQSAIGNVVSAFVSGGAQIVSTVLGWGGQIVSAVAGIANQMFSAGAHIVSSFVSGLKSISVGGVVAGIFGGITSLIPHSPAKEGPFSGSGWTSVFTGGQAIGQQFQDGLEQGFQGVLDRSKALLGQINDQIHNGIKPDPKQISQQLKAIEVESDQLRVQRDALDKKDPQRKKLDDQMSQLRTVKDQLGLQQEQLGYAKDYGEQQDKNGQIVADSLNKMVGIGVSFGQANAKQFLSDIGASGNGAVEKVADTGISFATKMLGQLINGAFGVGGHGSGTTIHVNSVDDALQAKQTIDNRKALQYSGR